MLEETLAVMVYFLFLVFTRALTLFASRCPLHSELCCAECASCVIDVGLQAVQCIMHTSRGLCMCIMYVVRDDVHQVFLDLTASS